MNTIILFNTEYPIVCKNDVSQHGVPYTETSFSVPVENGDVDFSIRRYTKNTYFVVEYWDDRCSGPDIDSIAGPLIRTGKYPNEEMTETALQRKCIAIVLDYGEPTGEISQPLF